MRDRLMGVDACADGDCGHGERADGLLAVGGARILVGDVRAMLSTLPAESVHCVVTSPPYWSLRSYSTDPQLWGGDPVCEHSFDPDPTAEGYTGKRKWQHSSNGTPVTRKVGNNPSAKNTLRGGKGAPDTDKYNSNAWAQITRGDTCRHCGCWRGELGGEPTPELYVEHIVEVFREVRRVLRKDGTCWVNLGDSYAGSWGAQGRRETPEKNGWRNSIENHPKTARFTGSTRGLNVKPKDLVGIPWLVARALQQPYYTGKIKRERDRVWLAAMIDGEGCMFIHRRKVGQSNGQGYVRKSATYGAGLEIANTSEHIIRRCMEITGRGSIVRQEKDRRQPLYRWNMRSNECRDVIREVYPYLIGKQHQARLLLGCPSSGERAEAAHAGLIALHNGEPTDVDFPPPASLYEEGFYLRSDIIWSKSNPMPESVQDRPTRSHEYLFMLSRSSRYYYDADAVREAHADVPHNRGPRWIGDAQRDPASRTDGMSREAFHNPAGRNRRSVWEIPTSPLPEAHFASYPEKLVEPCILAGTSERGICRQCGAPWRRVTERVGGTPNPRAGRMQVIATGGAITGGTEQSTLGGGQAQSQTTGWQPTCKHPGDPIPATVLDIFLGSGTTARVAERLGRNWIGIELSESYAAIARRRTAQRGLMQWGAAAGGAE